MPAPLARGIIVSISLLIAAGIAVYENPQVREWFDESRRKIALSLHGLGDEIYPAPRARDDASAREDSSPEAAERRRLAREEINRRAQALEEKRRGMAAADRRGSSFDDLVDSEGRLHEKVRPSTTSAEPVQAEGELRKRNTEAAGLAMGTAVADPFSDEMGIDFSEKAPELPSRPIESRESTATLQNEPFVVDTDMASSVADETFSELTPTTSVAPSFPQPALDTPTSESETLDNDSPAHMPSNFQSVHEWAEASTSSFYSAPESEASSVSDDIASHASLDASIIDASDSISQVDAMSEAGEITTPGSWTEVGSMISGNSL